MRILLKCSLTFIQLYIECQSVIVLEVFVYAVLWWKTPALKLQLDYVVLDRFKSFFTKHLICLSLRSTITDYCENANIGVLDSEWREEAIVVFSAYLHYGWV